MAFERGFTGFEGGEADPLFTTIFQGAVLGDETARSGEFFLRMQNATAVSNTAASMRHSGVASTYGNGSSCVFKIRFFVRLNALPSATVAVGGKGTGITSWRSVMMLDSTGHFAAFAHNTTGSFSAAALGVGVWYRVELSGVGTHGVTSSVDTSVSVYSEDGLTLIGTVTASGSAVASLAMDTAFSVGNSSGTAATSYWDFDDWFWVIGDTADAASVVLPTATRITRVTATAQGASADWVGDYRKVIDVPMHRTITDEQTTSTLNATTTFAHATAAALGIGTIAGICCRAFWKASGGAGNDSLMINGAEFTVAVPATYAATTALRAYDFTAYSSSQFDALEFGAKNKRGVAEQLGKCYLEVLHDGAGVVGPGVVGSGYWHHKVVTWIGNGTYQDVAVGFAPRVIIVKKTTATGGTLAGCLKLASMGGTQSWPAHSTTGDGLAVMAVTPTGFSLGPSPNANASGVSYTAICIQDDGQHTDGFFLGAGLYYGTGLDNRDIVMAEAFQPDALLIYGNLSLVVYRGPNMAGDFAMPIAPSTTSANQIQAMNATGFQLGSGFANGALVTYYYVAIRLGLELAEFFAASEFTAAAATHSVSSLLFSPALVIADRVTGGVDGAWRNVAYHTGANSSPWAGGADFATGITSLDAAGFTVGSTLAAAGVTTYYLAMAAEGEVVDPAEVEFGGDDDQSGATIGLHWIHFYDKAGTEHVWSKLDLPDPGSYYGGFKDGRVMRFGLVKRALSDPRGEYEGTTFSWVLSDVDRVLRGLLASLSTKWIKGRNVIMRTISDVARRALETPRTVVRGLVTKARPLSPLHFELTAEDWFASKFRVGKSEQQIPKRKITRADFPNCPTDVIDRAVPIIYGELSDEGSSTPPPIPTGSAVRGAYSEGGNWVEGFGNLPSDVAVGDIIVSTPVAAAGGTLSADVPNGVYGVIVTGVDASGRESDPTPFYYDQANGGGRGSFPGSVPQVAVDGTQKIQAAWTAAAGAAKYRAYLCWYYYGTRFVQYIETVGLSCEFTASPSWTQPADATNITPGANVAGWAQFWWYAVSAVMPDGETGRSVEVFGMTRGFRREVRVEWLEVPGALGYRIYRRGALGTYDRKWEVGGVLFFDDDLLDTGATFITGAPAASGVVPVIHVGLEADAFGYPWDAFLVCGHAVKSIAAWFSGGVRVHAGTAGVDWLVPGHTGYGTYFPNTGSPQYRDLNGRRYTLIYVRGPFAEVAKDGSKPITLNLQGIEDTGDGTGALITDVIQQYKHALKNWLVGDYQGGAWLASPAFEDDADLPQIDEASFDAASAVAATRISGGYIGGAMIGAAGEQATLREMVARFNLSADVDCGFNRKTQFMVSMESDAIALLDGALELTQTRDIVASSFESEDLDDRHENIVPYSYAFNYSTNAWGLETELPDDESIDNYGVELTATRVLLYYIRHASIAADIAARRLARSADPPRLVRLTVGLVGLSIELGEIVLITHGDGIGASGWTQNPVRIVRHEFDPDGYSVRLEAIDMAYVFDGAFILGDETVLPTLWTSATAAQKRYGFLADETTEQFSNGAAIKRLR